MPKHSFDVLLQQLVEQGGLKDEYLVSVKEKFFMFLQMVGKGDAFRNRCNIWQCGAGTAVSYGEEVLKVILSLKDEYIRQPDVGVPTYIRARPQLRPRFDHCEVPLTGLTSRQSRTNNNRRSIGTKKKRIVTERFCSLRLGWLLDVCLDWMGWFCT